MVDAAVGVIVTLLIVYVFASHPMPKRPSRYQAHRIFGDLDD